MVIKKRWLKKVEEKSVTENNFKNEYQKASSKSIVKIIEKHRWKVLLKSIVEKCRCKASAKSFGEKLRRKASSKSVFQEAPLVPQGGSELKNPGILVFLLVSVYSLLPLIHFVYIIYGSPPLLWNASPRFRDHCGKLSAGDNPRDLSRAEQPNTFPHSATHRSIIFLTLE